MLIKSVNLRNIRSYQSQKIEFPQGNVLLAGDVGSGKSSILLAMEFALFGLKRGELTGNSLLRHGAKQGQVELKFQLGKSDIIIKRTLKRTSKGVTQDSGYIIHNGVKTEGTPVELKTKVLELLGYPPSFVTKQKDVIYRYTVYTPQEQMKQILFEDQESRLDTLRTVFDIDKYKRIRSNTALFVKELKNKASEYSGSISDLEQKKKQLQDEKEKLNQLDEQLKREAENLQQAKQAAQEKKKQLESCQAEEKQYKQLKSELEVQEAKLKEKVSRTAQIKKDHQQLEQQVKDTRKKLESIKIEKVEGKESEIEKAIEQLEKQINRVENQTAVTKEKLNTYTKSIQQAQQDLTQKRDKLAQLKKSTAQAGQEKQVAQQKTQLQKQAEQNTRSIDQVKQRIEQCRAAIQNAEQIKQGVASKEKCPVCLQPITPEHRRDVEQRQDRIISQNQEELDAQGKKLSQLEQEKQKLENQLQELQKKESQLEAAKVQSEMVASLEKEISQKNQSLEELQAQRKQLNQQLEALGKQDVEKKKQEVQEKKELKRKLREAQKLKQERDNLSQIIQDKQKTKHQLEDEQQRVKKEIGAINQKKLQLNQKLQKYQGIEEKLNKLTKEHDQLSKKEREAEIRKVSAEKEKQAAQQNVQNLEKEINTKKEAQKKLKKLNHTRQWLEDFFTNLVDVMEKNVMGRLYNEFNELFQNWFRLLVEDQNITVRLDDTFSPVIEQNGYETFLEHLSGGEKTSCALAYRLALNKVINDFVGNIHTKDIIILDEPTDGFSSEQLEKVRDVLDQINIRQVIIVSHEPKIESFVDRVIRIAKHEHVSSVV